MIRYFIGKVGRLFVVCILFLIVATSILSKATMTDDTKEAGASNDDRYVHTNSKYCIAAANRNCDNCDLTRYTCNTFNDGRMWWCCPIW